MYNLKSDIHEHGNYVNIEQASQNSGRTLEKEQSHPLLETPLHIQRSVEGKHNYFVHIRCPEEEKHTDSNSCFSLLCKNSNGFAGCLAESRPNLGADSTNVADTLSSRTNIMQLLLIFFSQNSNSYPLNIWHFWLNT